MAAINVVKQFLFVSQWSSSIKTVLFNLILISEPSKLLLSFDRTLLKNGIVFFIMKKQVPGSGTFGLRETRGRISSHAGYELVHS